MPSVRCADGLCDRAMKALNLLQLPAPNGDEIITAASLFDQVSLHPNDASTAAKRSPV